MRTRTLHAVFIIAVILATAGQTYAQLIRLPDAVPERPIINVSGQAEVMIAPDQVLFRLSNQSIDLDLKKAKAKNDDDVKKVVLLARSYKVEPQNVQTSYISVSKHYTGSTQTKAGVFDGYSVQQSTTVLLTDISRFEALLSDIVKAGVTTISDVTFRAAQMRKYMDEARASAMKAAREKAAAMAGDVGQHIGKAISITEMGLSVSSAYEDEDSSSSMSNNISTSEFNPKAISDTQGSIAPGMISIVARVKVTFELN